MRNKPMNYFLILLYLSIFTSKMYGKCARFNIVNQVNQIPYIVQGIVVQSNKSSLTYQEPEEHNFTIHIIKTLKGDIVKNNLNVQYIFKSRKPSISTFDINDTYIFAIKSIENGNATLFGTSCGREGIPFYTNELMQAINK